MHILSAAAVAGSLSLLLFSACTAETAAPAVDAEPTPDAALACPAGLPGTDAEIAATPRADAEAEWLALYVGGGFTADTPTYERVLRDLTAMRTQLPSAASLQLRAPLNDVTLTVDESTFASMKAGSYDAWDCMHARYGWGNARFDGLAGSGFARGEPNGRFNQVTMTELYRALPGVTSVSYDGWAGDGDRLCATREGETMHYVFSRGSGDCPAGCTDRDYTHVATDAAGTVTQSGTATASDQPRPDWVSRYAQERCLR